MQKCPVCSKKTDDSRHYCPRCGAALISAAVDDNAPRDRAEKDKAAKSRLTVIISIVCLIAILLTALLIPGQRGYTDAELLTEEYLALFAAGKSDKIAKLFLPELIDASELSALDLWSEVYGVSFEKIGIYDVTDSSPMDADSMRRELRNSYGIEPGISDYTRLLAGIIVQGSDLWLQLDLVMVDGYWYICWVRY